MGMANPTPEEVPLPRMAVLIPISLPCRDHGEHKRGVSACLPEFNQVEVECLVNYTGHAHEHTGTIMQGSRERNLPQPPWSPAEVHLSYQD